MTLELTSSPHFLSWLAEAGISLAFTTYQTNRLFLIGRKPDGALSTFERHFDRPMGLCVSDDTLAMSTRWQLWEFANALPAGVEHEGYDRVYVPRRAHTTGDLDIHDIALDRSGRIIFVNTLYSCLATVSPQHSFALLWQPPFISRLAAEDRCHLNGLAMADGAPAYVTSTSRSDVAAGWRDRRADGGVLVDTRSNQIVLSGLSMPHSPRAHHGQIWLQNAGTGELGVADLAAGRFEPVAFCPGFMRGMAFWGDYAIVGLSKSRHDKTFGGLALDDNLRARDAEAQCGLWVIDTRSGTVAHWLRLDGVVVELYDVQVLPGVRRPMALGFQTDEIQRLISIQTPERVYFEALGAGTAEGGKPPPPAAGSPPPSPIIPPAEYVSANRLVKQGRFAEALTLYQRALEREPRLINGWINLGACHWQLGDRSAAAQCYERALTIDPSAVPALANLALLLRAQGLVESALRHYRAALAARPDDIELLNEYGLALVEDGQVETAAETFQRVIRLNPANADARNNLAGVFKLREDLDAALRLHQEAARLRPDFFVALDNIGKIFEDRHEVDDARRAYARALRVKDDPLLRLRRELLCPPVFASAAALDAYRARVEAILNQTAERSIPIDLARAQSTRAEPPFDWAYHGRDNAALKRKYATLFSILASPPDPPPRPAGQPIRVCFVVTPSHEGVFMRCMGGIVDRLDPARFEVTLACSRAGETILRQGVSRLDARYLRLPLRVDQMAARLGEGRFDVLYYWEVGTDSSNYFLPFLRLAPIQCSGWGWPDTSGAPNLDYHLTSEALAGPDADSQFTETLRRLPHLPAYVQRSPIPAARDRRVLERIAPGIGPAEHLYLCVQNLRKAHPDMDAMLGGILRGDPRGRIAFIADPQPVMGRLLRERWASTLPDVADRILLLPRLNPDEYFAVIGLADVILDTPHFGGSNTSYDAFSAGVPVVTLPGPFPRGRYTAALYAAMGIEDCVAGSAEAYVDIALRLGLDRRHRDAVSAAIRDGAHALFEQPAAVTQFEDFLAWASARTA